MELPEVDFGEIPRGNTTGKSATEVGLRLLYVLVLRYSIVHNNRVRDRGAFWSTSTRESRKLLDTCPSNELM